MSPRAKPWSSTGTERSVPPCTQARALLAAHPTWSKIAVVGINDDGVVGVLEAAEQLGRAKDIIGWGQSGDLDTGANVDPHLLGSVFYFLEGTPMGGPLLKEIAAGHVPLDGGLYPQQPGRAHPTMPRQYRSSKEHPGLLGPLGQDDPGEPGDDAERRLFCPKS